MSRKLFGILVIPHAQSLHATLRRFTLLAPFALSSARPSSQNLSSSADRSPPEATGKPPLGRQAPLSVPLQSCGLPHSSLRKVLSKNPLLNAPHHSESLSSGIRRLKEMGLSAEALSAVLEEAPGPLMNSRNAEQCVDFLRRMGFTTAELNRICTLFPRVLAFDVVSRLRPLFGELDQFGFRAKVVRGMVVQEPCLILGMEGGEMLRYHELLTSLKCRVPIKERIFQRGPLSAILDVKRVADCLCQHGLIRRDALGIIWREPRVLLYGSEDISKKIHYLLNTMRLNIDALVDVPQFLGVNLEKQIIPRFQVVEHLRSMGALDLEVTLWHMVKPSRMNFYNMFVKPYPECEQLFRSSQRDVETKKKHVPAGLWKLFNPPKYPKSNEDANSMKNFLESLA